MARPSISAVALILWAGLIGAGLVGLVRYETKPGAAASGAPSAAIQSIGMDSGKMTLVMFIHPRCPCSAASIEELSQLMSRAGGRVRAFVVAFQPGDEPDDWSRTDTWRSASRIRGVIMGSDVNAVLARKCGAQTSGQVFLYDTDGTTLFDGGITGSRGHVGENDGLDAVYRIIAGQTLPRRQHTRAPVFGCAIISVDARREAPSITPVHP